MGVNFEQELAFFYEICKRCHVKTAVYSAHDAVSVLTDSYLCSVIGGPVLADASLDALAGGISGATKYKLTDPLGLGYAFLRLPTEDEKNILFVGPYLAAPLSAGDILERGERVKLPPDRQELLREYFASLPVIAESDRFLLVLDALCARVFGTAAFASVELTEEGVLPLFVGGQLAASGDFDEALANVERLERRYAFENEIMRAVRLGLRHTELHLSAGKEGQMLERRLQDPVRNAKNYCIIMNTLLRKAAEQGGVHPLHIDRLSSDFAMKIEAIAEWRGFPELMQEMLASYCRLVRRHATAQYSRVVKSTVLLIDSDVSAELSLVSLAQKQGVTPGYLATVFKKETGKTVMAYIKDKRIARASHLLATTKLQIQTVAAHCGMMDVHYFSRLFKRETGKTPKEYRASAQK